MTIILNIYIIISDESPVVFLQELKSGQNDRLNHKYILNLITSFDVKLNKLQSLNFRIRSLLLNFRIRSKFLEYSILKLNLILFLIAILTKIPSSVITILDLECSRSMCHSLFIYNVNTV